jgi:uncharacterized OsmC-like protein
MTSVTVRAGVSGAMEEVIFGAPGAEGGGNGADGEPSPYDYLLMSLGA